MIIPSQEFKQRALECRRTAQAAKDPLTRETWARLAKRWEFCAELAARERESAQGRGRPIAGPERRGHANAVAGR